MATETYRVTKDPSVLSIFGAKASELKAMLDYLDREPRVVYETKAPVRPDPVLEKMWEEYISLCVNSSKCDDVMSMWQSYWGATTLDDLIWLPECNSSESVESQVERAQTATSKAFA